MTKTFNTGDRVRFTAEVERYPFTIVAAGETGTVAEATDEILSVRLDVTHPGLEEWGNEYQVRMRDWDIDESDVLEHLEIAMERTDDGGAVLRLTADEVALMSLVCDFARDDDDMTNPAAEFAERLYRQINP